MTPYGHSRWVKIVGHSSVKQIHLNLTQVSLTWGNLIEVTVERLCANNPNKLLQ